MHRRIAKITIVQRNMESPNEKISFQEQKVFKVNIETDKKCIDMNVDGRIPSAVLVELVSILKQELFQKNEKTKRPKDKML